MNTRTAVLVAAATLVLLAAISAAPIGAQQSRDVLTAGTYTAKVKAIVCSGCGPLIKQTLEKMKEIDSVSVDSGKKTVQFAVKKNNTVKLSDLQKALKVAADRMGMGADYTLLDLKALK
jgi:hypothetical protein